VNVRDLGAVGDGQQNDTGAFNLALTALAQGGELYIPEGTYLLTPEAGTPDRALDLGNLHDIRVIGDGMERSVIRLAAGTYSGDTHLVFLRRSRYISFEDLTLDGNKGAAQFADEQNHCVEIWSSVEISFTRTRFTNCRGDGIRLLGVPSAGEPWTETVKVQDSEFQDNGRSGLAVQRSVRGLTVLRNTFDRISDQSIDIEPTGGQAPTDILIQENVIRHSSATWAVAIGGVGGTNVARRLTFRDNRVLDGAVLAYKVDELLFEDNVIMADPRHVPLRVTHSVTNSRIVGNDIQASAGGDEGIVQIVALNGAHPEGVVVSGNTIQAPQGASGILVRDALGAIDVSDNRIMGSGGKNGIAILTVVETGRTRAQFKISSNHVENFRNGIQISRRSDPFSDLMITSNTIQGKETITGVLFESTGEYETFAVVTGNIFGVEVNNPIQIQ
jgi:hypothetical protein